MLEKIIKNKELAIFLIGQLFTFIGGMYLIKILTDGLNPQDYGKLSLILTATMLFNQVIAGGIIASAGRYYSVALNKNELSDYYKALISITKKITFTTLVGAIAIFAAFKYIAKYQNPELPILIGLLVIAMNAVATINSIQSAARKREAVAIFSSLEIGFKMVIVLIFFKNSKITPEWALFGFLCSMIIVLIIQIAYIKNNIILTSSNCIQTQYWKETLLKYAKPFTIWGVFTWAQQASDKWSLQKYSDESAVGRYTLAYQISYGPIANISGMIANFLVPILFELNTSPDNSENKKKSDKIILQITSFVLITAFTLGFCIFFGGEALIDYFFDEKYLEIHKTVPILILAGGLYSAGQMLAIKILNDFDSKRMIKVKIISSIVGVTFNIIGAKMAGEYGVAIAAVMFSMVHLIWIFWLVKKQ